MENFSRQISQGKRLTFHLVRLMPFVGVIKNVPRNEFNDIEFAFSYDDNSIQVEQNCQKCFGFSSESTRVGRRTLNRALNYKLISFKLLFNVTCSESHHSCLYHQLNKWHNNKALFGLHPLPCPQIKQMTKYDIFYPHQAEEKGKARKHNNHVMFCALISPAIEQRLPFPFSHWGVLVRKTMKKNDNDEHRMSQKNNVLCWNHWKP